MPAVTPDEMELEYSEWRDTQIEAFAKVADWYETTNDNNYAIEAPTGTGKTGLALGIGYERSMVTGDRTIICVATVQEQKQYRDAFLYEDEPYWFASLSGRGRYICDVTGVSEADSDPNLDHRDCEYTHAVDRARKSLVLVVNYALARVGFNNVGNDLFGVQDWGGFDTMILDECHDIPSIMEDWFSFRMSDRDWELYVQSDYDTKFSNEMAFWKEYSESQNYRDDRVDMKHRLDLTEEAHYSHPTRESREELRTVRRIEQNLEKLSTCVLREDVFTKEDNRVAFTPAFPPPNQASRFYENARRRLFMSGTILASPSSFRRGIGVQECEIDRLANPFPAKNSPLFFLEGPSLAYKTRKPIRSVYKDTGSINEYAPISEHMPEAIGILDRILEKHSGRVMVHAHSNLNAAVIGQYSLHRDRMEIHDSTDWDSVFARYKATPGSVLVAAGRTEAVDLPGDLCEAVVMFKLPYAPFSAVEKKRQEISSSYYAATMLQTIRQARGRGVRSAEDKCPCYVIESRYSAKGKATDFTKNAAFKGIIAKKIPAPKPLLAEDDDNLVENSSSTKSAEKTTPKALTEQGKLL